MSSNIYCGNLSYNTTEDSLREIFSDFGEIVSVKIISDRNTGRSRGFGFVEMSDSTAADNAVQQLNGAELDGRNIRINIARPKKY